MKREIKFRAWNGKKMIYNIIPTSFDRYGYFEKEGYESVFKYSFKGKLMHFSGLKDKNGIEIYEGDLLVDEDGNNTIVVWIDDWAMFGCLFQDEYFSFKNKGISEIDETMFWTFPIENNLLKVIGNIYEQQTKKP